MYIRKRMDMDTYFVQFCCDKCQSKEPPLLRVVGMLPESLHPPKIRRKLKDGTAVITGCSFGEAHEMLDYECSKCGFGTDMPDDYKEKTTVVKISEMLSGNSGAIDTELGLP